jgi:hypothetical protein
MELERINVLTNSVEYDRNCLPTTLSRLAHFYFTIIPLPLLERQIIEILLILFLVNVVLVLTFACMLLF